MELILFDDAVARGWLPFTLTRPAGELRHGTHTFRERAEHFAGTLCRGHLAGGRLAPFDEPGSAPGLGWDDLASPSRHGRLFLSSRVVPAVGARFAAPAEAGVVRLGGRVAGWFVTSDVETPPREFFDSPETFAPAPDTVSEHEGLLVDHVWQMVTELGAQIERDFEEWTANGNEQPLLNDGVHVIGNAGMRLRIASSAHIEPGVVLDVTHGPIWIEEGVRVRAFTRLAGPAWVGAGSTLLGGPFECVSIGPVCRVHGEIEESLLLGYSNKAHDGFLGHACIGRWVNLGALTTNSDLKNNYGSVRIWTPHGEEDTGAIKMGCLLGDHVKTGIGVMLNTGTVVGAGSNLFGARQPARNVPAFSWGSGDELSVYQLDRFLTMAETVMSRRGTPLTPGMRAVLEGAWQETWAG